MKKIQLLLLLPAILAVSCNKENITELSPQEEIRVENCQLNITLDNGTDGTKASAYTAVLPYEKTIKSIEVLVFNDNGTIEKYAKITGTTCSFTVTQGKKHIYAFANCFDLSYITHTWELDEQYITLSNFSKANGFAMHGDTYVTCSANTSTPCSIELKRYAARIALTNVYLNLSTYVDEAYVEGVFLTNVVSSRNLTGDYVDEWCNVQGRNFEDDMIIYWDGYYPDYEDQTGCYYDNWLDNGCELIFEDDYDYPFLGYAFANSSTKSPNGPGLFNWSTGERTCLVVEMYINSETYYYPVVLDNGPLNENCAYTVSLTITGLGSKDPNTPIQKGTLSGTITVSNWSTGAVYDKTI